MNKPRECRVSYKLLNLPKQVGASLVDRAIPGGKPGFNLAARLWLPEQRCWLKAFKDNHAHRRA